VDVSIIISYRKFNNQLEKNLISLLNYLSWLTSDNINIILIEMDKESTINWLDKIKKNQFIKHIYVEDRLSFNKFKGYNIGANESLSDILIFNDINSFIKLSNYKIAISELNRFFNFYDNIIIPYNYIIDSNIDISDKFLSNNFNFNIFHNKPFRKIDDDYIGNIFITKRKVFLNIGGFNNNYHNNKYEKFIFKSKIGEHNIKIKNINGELVKLKNYDIFLPNYKENENIPFSIIISTKDDKDYIENCLESIQQQEYFINNNNYEILIGVNGCYDTLYKLNQLYHKFNNLKIYMMESGKTDAVVYNTLIGLTSYENIIVFNGNSIMLPDMINQISLYVNHYDLILLKGVSIKGKSIYDNVIFYKKSIFELIGGYCDWEFLYTKDLLQRCDKILKIKDLTKKVYKNTKDITIDKENTSIFLNKIKDNKKNKIIKVDRVCDNYTFVIGNSTDKSPISIIITAYQVKDFIEECLLSIENQTYFVNNDNYEILIGVDNCKETLDKLLDIKYKYRNVRVFMMNENKGTYITTNTLLDIVKFDNIIRFDSDDVMRPNMIEKIMLYSDKYNFIRFKYFNMKYDSNGQFIMKHTSDCAHGVVYMKKSLIDEIGGYQPWPCASDSELLVRAKNILIEKTIDEVLFYRRIHDNSLTRNKKFGLRSDIREKYRKMINKHKSLKIDRITNEYKEY